MVCKHAYLEALQRSIEMVVPSLRQAQEESHQHGTVKTGALKNLDGWLAHCCGYCYSVTDETRYAELARDALLLEPLHGGFTQVWSARGYGAIATCEAISAADKEQIRAGLAATADNRNELKWGLPVQWNGPMIQVVGNLAIARALPEHPHAQEWARLSDKFMADWLKVGDIAEDTSNYEPLTFVHVLLYGDYVGRTAEILADRNVGALAERYLTQVPPVGVMPDYGDSSWGVEWGLWLAVMLRFAACYGDGRYRWAAERFYAFAQEQHWWDSADTVLKTSFDINALALAHAWLDEEVEAVRPTSGSAVTYRTLYKLNFTPEPQPAPGHVVEWAERREDKLILRSGWDRSDAYLCLNLQGRVSHDHSDAGAIITYTDRGAVLLHDTSYIQRHNEFHNLLFVQAEDAPFARPPWPHSGERYAYKPQMRYLVEFPRVVLSAFESRGYFGYPITHVRTVLFDKQRAPVAIHDRALIHEGSYALGPLYHVAQVTGQGAHHFCTDQGQPYHHHGIQLSSPEARLVIALPLASGDLGEFVQEAAEHPFRYAGEKRGLPDAFFDSFNNDTCVYQFRRAEAGEHVHFLTLLAPQGVADDSSAWAAHIQVLADGAQCTAVRYRNGEREVTVGFRGDGSVRTAALDTDALAVHLEHAGPEATVSFHEATYLALDGHTVFATLDWHAEEKRDVSRAFRVPSAISGELSLRPDGASGLLYVYDCYEPGIPVGKVEVGFSVPAAPRRLCVDGQEAPADWDAATGILKLAVRGKTAFSFEI
ncbi:MAG: hypothetical protein GX557_08470 [Chloroflexi bacterium]|nr:hypothetical protein [Chloroflexota bacterium]